MTENGYNVQIQVRNNHILKRIRNQYGSSAKMCKETGLVATAVSALLCFREKPFLMDGSLSTAAFRPVQCAWCNTRRALA
jgi:hypothetical protein